ncbi:MAG: rod shape-determining protein MreC [Gammaproteobacteria bacterium]|nr:rod shape-determining protein MreC [Gammaproteobacteria bacterium]
MRSLVQQSATLTLNAILMAIFCVVLMTIDHRNDALKGARSTVASFLVYPIQYVVSAPANILHWSRDNLSSRNTLLETISDLHKQNLQLMAQQQQLLSLQQENARLRELLHASSRVGEEILVAEVLTVDQDYYKQQIVINKGEVNNVLLGQPVIDAMGVMGQVIELNQYSASVLLISDPSHALPVQNNRNGIRSIVQGKGDPGELDLLHIPNNADIKVGDLLITSGLGGRFPPNYPVATITDVEIRPGQPFARVIAKPAAALEISREVLLVWPGKEVKP